MERIEDSARSIAATTREMRAIARRAQIMGLNRQMTPSQYQLLDADGTHVLMLIAVHTDCRREASRSAHAGLLPTSSCSADKRRSKSILTSHSSSCVASSMTMHRRQRT